MSSPTQVIDVLSTSPVLKTAIKKAAKHLMPMLIILYFVAFLDRTNVGFAEAALKVDRGVSDGAFALGAGIFFIGYALFEIPSNLLLKRFGAKFWLARIAVTWGITAAAFAFVTDERMFIILRFLLGVTEAGLFPGVIMYLAAWFPNKVRVQMFALFYLAQPFSQMLGAPLSGGLIALGGATAWHGWQVMFFVEGMLAVVAGVAALYFLINSPQDAKFLNAEEKEALETVMATEDAVRTEDGPNGIWAAMASPIRSLVLADSAVLGLSSKPCTSSQTPGTRFSGIALTKLGTNPTVFSMSAYTAPSWPSAMAAPGAASAPRPRNKNATVFRT